MYTISLHNAVRSDVMPGWFIQHDMGKHTACFPRTQGIYTVDATDAAEYLWVLGEENPNPKAMPINTYRRLGNSIIWRISADEWFIKN